MIARSEEIGETTLIIEFLSLYVGLLEIVDFMVIFDFERTFLSGLRRTTRSLGRNKHERITVALKLKHIANVVS